jgi:hypothetical protein
VLVKKLNSIDCLGCEEKNKTLNIYHRDDGMGIELQCIVSGAFCLVKDTKYIY